MHGDPECENKGRKYKITEKSNFAKTFIVIHSKSPRVRTCFFESQAEIGSYFKGTKTSFKIYCRVGAEPNDANIHPPVTTPPGIRLAPSLFRRISVLRKIITSAGGRK